MKLKTLGFDVEFFLKMGMSGYIDPSEVTTGTKEEPEKVADSLLTWQKDGLALELGWASPINVERGATGLAIALSEAYQRTAELLWRSEIMLDDAVIATFSDELIASGGELGCSPDYNAYTAKMNTKPSKAILGNTRCKGMHIHIGAVMDDGRRLTSKEMLRLVKAMDVTVGSGKIGEQFLAHSARTEFYGSAGAFRPKPYGVEYRVPSYNFMEDGMKVYRAIKDAVDLCNSNDLEEIIELKGGEASIIERVNSGRAVLSTVPRRTHTINTHGILNEWLQLHSSTIEVEY